MENMNIVKKILLSSLVGLILSMSSPLNSLAVEPSSVGVPPVGTPSETYGYNRGIINNSPSRLPVGDIAKPTVDNITKKPSIREINTLPP